MVARRPSRRQLGVGDHLITTALRTQNCRHCHRQILAGHSNGTPIRLDPTRLNPIGEAAALLAGLHTYEIDESSARFGRLAHLRLAHNISRPLRDGRYVLAAHHCGRQWPPQALDARPPPPEPPGLSESDTAPF